MTGVLRCPLTARQYECFEHLARGSSRRAAAAAMNITLTGVNELLRRGCGSLGADDVDDALRVLDATGWLHNSRLSTAAQEYIRAFEAYILAPRHGRNEERMRELCDAALDELLDTPR